MVSFYGAGERTAVLNVEGKLGKALGKETNTLVVKAADRQAVVDVISERIARYEKYDPEIGLQLRQLRESVKNVFNKGLEPGDEIMEQLWFLDPKTRELVEKMSGTYAKVVTPDDFKAIAKIMSEHLSEQVPILKDFTRFFGRLAQDYLVNSKPSKAAMDWTSVAKGQLLGSAKKGYTLPDRVAEILGIRAGESVTDKLLERYSFWSKDATLREMLGGVKPSKDRRTGFKFMKLEVVLPTLDLKKWQFLEEKKLFEIEVLGANKLPKSWTSVPWRNFDGHIIEQNFTQAFEERLSYKDASGNWVNNLIKVDQKTETSWWEELANTSGKINDIADATKARTAFAVNGE